MSVHLALAWLSAGLAAVVLLLAALGALRRSMPRFAIDRAILVTEASVAAGLLTGLVQLATTSGPADGLHLLYAAIALLALPVGRLWGASLTEPPRALPLTLAALAVLGVLFRLGQTG